MNFAWEEPKDPTDEDFYEVEVKAGWLGTDTITSATFTVDSKSSLVFSEPQIQGNLVRIFVTGGYPGDWEVEVTLNTSTGRVRQRTVILKVQEL